MSSNNLTSDSLEADEKVISDSDIVMPDSDIVMPDSDFDQPITQELFFQGDARSLTKVLVESSILGKHELPSSSPLPTPFLKRFRTYSSDAHFSDGSEHIPNKKNSVQRRDESNDLPEPNSDSNYSMEYTTAGDTTRNTDAEALDFNELLDINIDSWCFKRGPKQLLAKSAPNAKDIPTIIHVNLENGKVFQCAVDARLLNMFRREITELDAAKGLWSQIDFYAGNLRDRCSQMTSILIEDFPILRRHGKHFEITDSPLTKKDGTPDILQDVIKRLKRRLVARYGPLNDLQDEQWSLAEKGCYMLYRYMEAIVTREMPEMMDISDLLDPLGEALNELNATQYVIRDIFNPHRSGHGVPQFMFVTEN